MGRKYNFNESEIKDMINMYNNDLMGMHNIAKIFGVDESVIKNRLLKRNVKIAKGSPYSVKYWLQRGLSKSEATEHIKSLRPVNVEYWVKKGYSKEEAILQIEGQKLVSLRGCIARYGKTKGTKIWNDREGKRSDWGKMGSTNLQYWIDKGYSKEEAIIKRSERQSTFSKEICIEKYGEKEGLKIFTERQNKWNKSLTENGNLKSGYSKISQELFYELLNNYDIDEKDNIKFATHNGEFKLNKKDGGLWLYDFVDLNNNKIIEYNGDQFHGNPEKYLAEDSPNPFNKDIKAKDMWSRDDRKKTVANENGFEVLYIYGIVNTDGVINKK